MEGFPWDDLCKNFPWMSTDGQGVKWHRKIAENFNCLNKGARALQADRRQTDGRARIQFANRTNQHTGTAQVTVTATVTMKHSSIGDSTMN